MLQRAAEAWERERRRAAVARVAVRTCAKALRARAEATLVDALRVAADKLVLGLWVRGWGLEGRGGVGRCEGVGLQRCWSRWWA